MRHGRGVKAAILAVFATIVGCGMASAETLAEALASAYVNNSDLNAARASVRAADEGVPQALAGFRPSVSASGNLSWSTSRSNFSPDWSTASYSRGVSLSVEQPIFLGFRTVNGVKIARTAVLAAREQLKTAEAGVLLDAVQAFMGVVKAQVVLNLTAQNVEFLREQVKAADDRLNVGEGTKTDVAQTNARLQAGISDYNGAVAQLNSSIAVYEQVIGHKPKALGAANGVHKVLPPTLEQALAEALVSHPAIVAGLYNVDIASYNVKIVEGSLLPSVALSGSYSHGDQNAKVDSWSDSASVSIGASIPIYSGGSTSSRVREAKESLGQRQIQLDSTRSQIKANIISAWGTLDAAKAQVTAAESQVSAEQLVLAGVTEEQKVGQRTTLDVLNAQQELLNARVSLVTAQFNRVVAAYSLMASIGKLNAQDLGLKVDIYDPTEHYNAVKDKWFGLRTPDGR